jgi:hypothetical protein
MGRLVAWFESELAAIHLLFLDDAAPPKRRKRAKGKSRG